MKTLKIILILLIICGLFGTLFGCSSAEKERIIVGSKDFPEQYVLGNMLRVLLEENTNFEVVYMDNMASHVIFAAIDTGAVDIYVDYTGTIYGSYLNMSETLSADEVFYIASSVLMERNDLLVLDPLGFNNTFALAVRRDTADLYNLRTISDLAAVSSELIFGGSAEIISRYDGLPNLKRVYDMTFKHERVLHDYERYTTLINDEIQVSEIFSTDAMLVEYDIVVLEDDKEFFPPYYAVVLLRNELAQRHPELVELLRKLSGTISDDKMRSLNYKVGVQEEDPSDVAEGFLREINLIN